MTWGSETTFPRRSKEAEAQPLRSAEDFRGLVKGVRERGGRPARSPAAPDDHGHNLVKSCRGPRGTARHAPANSVPGRRGLGPPWPAPLSARRLTRKESPRPMGVKS